MSLLDQAKKEAKRLFNLAKANQEIKSNNIVGTVAKKVENTLMIENLSKAREVLALINGYKSWHEYETILKKKDITLEKVDKNSEYKENRDIFTSQKDFIADIEFNKIINMNVKNDNKIIFSQEHKNIVLGKRKNSSFLNNQMQSWILHDYPVLVSGSTGAGKSESLLSMASQYIENKEGVIYFDGKGETVIYSKMFGYGIKHNRLNDIYCLNFMTGSKLPIKETSNVETLSHSIDPINPMLGNTDYFNKFFGRIGIIIHSILDEIIQKNELMDIQSLKSILMLNNLITWQKNSTFKTEEITHYLEELGLSLEEENEEEDFEEALLKHSTLCYKALKTVELLEHYSYIFKVDASVNIENIFLERKILLIMLPSFEKSPDYLLTLGKILIEQIVHIENKYQKYDKHLQNIIIDEFICISDSIEKIDFSKTKNNYIFGCNDYYYFDSCMPYVMINAKTRIIMKMNEPDLPKVIKLEMMDNMIEIPKLNFSFDNKEFPFIKNLVLKLNDLREGEAYVLSNNTYQSHDNNILNNTKRYYMNWIRCEYLPPKYEKSIYLVKQSQREIEIKK